MLETIRQYGAERMAQGGDDTEMLGRHLSWCLATAVRLRSEDEPGTGFDDVADDLRAALVDGSRAAATTWLARCSPDGDRPTANAQRSCSTMPLVLPATSVCAASSRRSRS